MDRLKKKFQLKESRVLLDYRLFVVLFIYIVLGVFIFSYYQYQINPDGIGYITTALSYMSGNFYGSISDYWGPLLSWLLIPLLFFGHTPLAGLHATKILSLILGFCTIIGVRQFSYRFEMDELIRTVILFILVPVVLYFAFSVITPDLLMVCVVVYYLTIIFDINYPNKLLNGILCGILGALAYLTKSYGFTFFISSFFILNVCQYFIDLDVVRRRNIVKNCVLGFVIFLMISGVWIGLISFKDKKFTIGTAGESNHALMGPESLGFPEYFQGIHKPGQYTSSYLPKAWSPFKSWNNFNYQLSLIWANTIKTGYIFNYFSFLSFIIILAYIIIFITQSSRLSQNQILYPLIILIISTGGYMMITVEERYLWMIYILLMFMGGYLINLIFKQDYFSKTRFSSIIKIMILMIFAFSFVFMPINYLVENVHTHENIYKLSETLNQYGIHGNVASNDELLNMNYLAYYMNITSYGQAKKNISSKELQNELKNYGIDYYFIWNNSNQNSYMAGYKEVTNNNIPNLKIYSIK
ncbi:MAG: hypothetical protein PHY59_05055 [Methanobacterium sp.]|nr:hypothetical protein [Methanobacterium sp.]